ncbi:MAG TPA: hypothetical protein DIT07_16850 [Sphingobacteriaceae bacterium]|nr:hypothetical protein [Sphingobacteriaceae bacterium]
MKNSTIIYSLTIEDIQTVANQEIGRELAKIEIKRIEEKIADKINWYDAIADSINEELSN